MAKKKHLTILINPFGRYNGEVYQSRINGKWYWHTKSARNGKVTAAGAEQFPTASNAKRALFAHKIDLKNLMVIY